MENFLTGLQNIENATQEENPKMGNSKEKWFNSQAMILKLTL